MTNFQNCQRLQFEVGKIYVFLYRSKLRQVTISKVGKTHITGFDHFANYPYGDYRTFKIDQVQPWKNKK